MPRVRPSEDVRPLTEFRSNMASYIDALAGRERPLILTQHGRSAAVLLGVDHYEHLLDELELLQDVRAAENELAAGKGRSASSARAEVLRQLAE